RTKALVLRPIVPILLSTDIWSGAQALIECAQRINSSERRQCVALWGRVFRRLLYALYRQRIPLLLVLLISASAGTYYLWLNQTNLPNQAAAAGSAPVEVTVTDLQGTVNNATLTLKEKNGQRRISMAVGSTEALAIARQRGSTQIPPDQQPQAYDL